LDNTFSKLHMSENFVEAIFDFALNMPEHDADDHHAIDCCAAKIVRGGGIMIATDPRRVDAGGHGTQACAHVIFDFIMGNRIMKSVAEQDQTSRQYGGENLFKFGEDGEGMKWWHMRTARC
jgi:hypothetical protein